MSVTREYDPSDLSEDYAEIERAVLESERGRWFLAEYAKRQRAADTALILDAIHRLKSAVAAKLGTNETEIGAATDASAGTAQLTPESLRYFRQDEDIFVPLPGSKPDRPSLRVVETCQEALPSTSPTPSISEAKASRVTIRRVNPDPHETAVSAPDVDQMVPDFPHSESQAATSTEALARSGSPENDGDRPRIFVVRRSSSELLAIPLANDTAESAVA